MVCLTDERVGSEPVWLRAFEAWRADFNRFRADERVRVESAPVAVIERLITDGANLLLTLDRVGAERFEGEAKILLSSPEFS